MYNSIALSSDQRKVFLIDDENLHVFSLESGNGVVIGLLGSQLSIASPSNEDISKLEGGIRFEVDAVKYQWQLVYQPSEQQLLLASATNRLLVSPSDESVELKNIGTTDIDPNLTKRGGIGTTDIDPNLAERGGIGTTDIDPNLSERSTTEPPRIESILGPGLFHIGTVDIDPNLVSNDQSHQKFSLKGSNLFLSRSEGKLHLTVVKR